MPFQKNNNAGGGKKGRSGRKTISEEALKIVKERTYKETMAEILPDKLLAEKHLELLTVPIKVRTIGKGKSVIEIEQIDSLAISKGLDMAYKIKGEYAPEKQEHSGTINFKPLLDGVLNNNSNTQDNKTEEED